MKHDWKVTLKKRGTELIELLSNTKFSDLRIGQHFLLDGDEWVKITTEHTGHAEGAGIVNAKRGKHAVGVGPLVRVTA